MKLMERNNDLIEDAIEQEEEKKKLGIIWEEGMPRTE